MTQFAESEHDDLPPIPDGGLRESFPDWLQQDPAWAERRAQVPIDLSPIDPRTLVGEEDLPEWLRLVAQRTHIVTASLDLRPAELEDFVPTLPKLDDHSLDEVASIDDVTEEIETTADVPVQEPEPQTSTDPRLRDPVLLSLIAGAVLVAIVLGFALASLL